MDMNGTAVESCSSFPIGVALYCPANINFMKKMPRYLRRQCVNRIAASQSSQRETLHEGQISTALYGLEPFMLPIIIRFPGCKMTAIARIS